MSDLAAQAHYQRVLEERARLLAIAPPARVARTVVAHAAVVAVGQESMAIPVDGVGEIVRSPPIARLPGLPAWLPGIVQLRGELLGVVHLARWLAVPEEAPPRFLVVLDGFELPLALLVSAVLGFRTLYADELADGLVDGQRSWRPVAHTTRDLVTVLDLPALVRHPDLCCAPRDASPRPEGVPK